MSRTVKSDDDATFLCQIERMKGILSTASLVTSVFALSACGGASSSQQAAPPKPVPSGAGSGSSLEDYVVCANGANWDIKGPKDHAYRVTLKSLTMGMFDDASICFDSDLCLSYLENSPTPITVRPSADHTSFSLFASKAGKAGKDARQDAVCAAGTNGHTMTFDAGNNTFHAVLEVEPL